MTDLDIPSPAGASALVVALVLLLSTAACTGTDDAPAPGPARAPIVDLPPPLVGGPRAEAPSPAAAAPLIDPDDWVMPDPEGDAALGAPPRLRLLVSQDNQAEVDPCGCPGSPSGGMSRRASLVAAARDLMPGLVVVEGPTCLSRAVLGIESVGGDERTRARTVLDALAMSRPDAFFPGQADFEVLAPAELTARASALGIPLVVTNGRPGALPGVRRSLVVDAEGHRVLLLGLVGAARNADQRAQVPLIDAVEAVRAEVAAAAETGSPPSLVVGFTDAERRELNAWKTAGLGVDVLFVPKRLRREDRVDREGELLIVRSDPLGRAFVRLDVAFSGTGRGLTPETDFALIQVAKEEASYLRRRLVPGGDPDAEQGVLAEHKYRRRKALERAAVPTERHRVAVSAQLIHPETEEAAAVRELLDRFNEERLGSLSAGLAKAGGPAPKGRVFQGVDACVECHPAETAQWSRLGHAGAWRTLKEAGQTRNPDCLGCHTTGFAVPGGFADPAVDTHLLNVQCEACHGPMDLHLTQVGRRGFRPDPGVPVVESVCTGCHDEANSKDFDFPTYSARAAHPISAAPGGGSPSAPPLPSKETP